MNEFQDGWGDEESLGVDVDVNVDVEDGWGDDELDMLNDEVEVDVDEDGAQAGTSGLIVQQGTETSRSCSNSTSTSNSNSAISVDEGWDWDDGDVNASNHGHGHGHGHGREHTIINTDTCSDIDTGVGVGVGNTRKGNDFGTHTNAAGGSVSGRSAVVDPDPEPILKIAEQKLLQYITDLGGDPSSSSSLLNSINDELALKHNNKEKALELCRYYHERENLREYTLDAEVPRMDYQIMISDDLILTETNEIQHYFHNHPVDNLVDDMLLRASNQSILADLFPVITGTGADKIIRMQFGANAVANKCRLVLDMRGRRMRTLQVECTLTVSVPAGSSSSMSTSTSTSTGTSSSSSSSSAKLDLAALRFMIHFSPEPSAPFIKYQLVSIQPLLDIHNNGNGNGNGDREKVRAAATLLDPREMEAIQEMTREHEHEHEHNNENDNNNVNVNVRDNFLNSVMATATHQTMTATTAGLKSALQEIDDVVNVKGKFNYLKNAMPVLALPSADEILTAERDFLQEEECPSANSSGSMNGSVSGHFPRPAPPPRPVPVQAPHQHQRHQPPAHSSSLSVSSINASHSNGNSIGIGNSNGADTGTNVHAATSTSRPKPIIGGMLISGITRLAKAAAIPDVNVNVNVDVNDHAASKSTSMQAQGSMPVLYRKEINVTASNPPPPPAPPHQQQWSDDGVDDAADDDDDGWSDDDLDDGLDDLDDDVDKALAPFLNQTTPTSASTSTSTSAFTKSASTTAITNVGQAPTPAPVNAMRNNNTNSIHVASSAISPSASTSTVNTGTSDTYIKIEHPKMDDHANANAKVSVNVNVNVNVNGPTKDNEYVGISSEYVNVDLNDHGLPVELKAERDYLLQQLTLIENTKNDDCDGLAVASRERECDYDEFTGIVPTRKRFVPRSHILNIVNIGVGGER